MPEKFDMQKWLIGTFILTALIVVANLASAFILPWTAFINLSAPDVLAKLFSVTLAVGAAKLVKGLIKQ